MTRAAKKKVQPSKTNKKAKQSKVISAKNSAINNEEISQFGEVDNGTENQSLVMNQAIRDEDKRKSSQEDIGQINRTSQDRESFRESFDDKNEQKGQTQFGTVTKAQAKFQAANLKSAKFNKKSTSHQTQLRYDSQSERSSRVSKDHEVAKPQNSKVKGSQRLSVDEQEMQQIESNQDIQLIESEIKINQENQNYSSISKKQFNEAQAEQQDEKDQNHEGVFIQNDDKSGQKSRVQRAKSRNTGRNKSAVKKTNQQKSQNEQIDRAEQQVSNLIDEKSQTNLAQQHDEIQIQSIQSDNHQDVDHQVIIPEKSKQEIEEEQLRLLEERKQNNQNYQNWQKRKRIFAFDLQKSLGNNLPQIFTDPELKREKLLEGNLLQQLTEQIQSLKAKVISDAGGINNFSLDILINDPEFTQIIMPSLSQIIEGSPKNLQNLTLECLDYISSNLLIEDGQNLDPIMFESLLMRSALRKCYGIKTKNQQIYSDENPKSLWCWELVNNSWINPIVSESKIKKIKQQRAVVGKKVQILSQIIDMVDDINTFENDEKIAKLEQEYQNYQLVIIKESQGELVKRKREIDDNESKKLQLDNELSKVSNPFSSNQSQNGSSKNSKSNRFQSRAKLTDDDEDKQSELLAQEKKNIEEVAQIDNSAQLSKIIPQKQQAIKSIMSFFPVIQNKQSVSLSNLMQKNENEGFVKNPYISFKNNNYEPVSKKIQQNNSSPSWSLNNLEELVHLLQQTSQQEVQEFRQTNNLHRLKHIIIYNSGMSYNGDQFFKKSQNLSCRNPFEMDFQCIDYDQNSDDEWHEIHCDNLEDDNLLAEEENSELNQDDPELRREGFIVADDYHSQDYSQDSFQPDDYEETKFVQNRRDLLRRQLEREENRLKSNIIQRTYINTYENSDLSNFKAVAFRRPLLTVRSKKRDESRRQSMNQDQNDQQQIEGFPIRVFKLARDQDLDKQKAQIKDYINDLIEIAHGCILSKKQLQEQIKQKYPELPKLKIEIFVKECFDKEKRHPDSKARLYARIDAIEKYGGDEQLIANMPLILESKRDQEIINRNQEAMNQVGPSQIESKSNKSSKISSKTVRSEQVQSQNEFHKYLQQTDDKEMQFQEDTMQNINAAEQIENVRQDDVSAFNESSFGVHNGNNSLLQSRRNDSWVTFQAQTPIFDNRKQHSSQQFDQIENNEFLESNPINTNEIDYNQNEEVHLSQHAIIQYKDSEKPVYISQESYCRNTQQNQSTPIHNFKKLKPSRKSLRIASKSKERQASQSANKTIYNLGTMNTTNQNDSYNPMIEHTIYTPQLDKSSVEAQYYSQLECNNQSSSNQSKAQINYLSQEANYYQSQQISQNTLITPKKPNRLDSKIRDLVNQTMYLNQQPRVEEYQDERRDFNDSTNDNFNTFPNDLTIADIMPNDEQCYENDDELNQALSQK
ncbi:UNKNOWN [Stylonychia lemnae]|uniref:Chromatin assembly factor 1 subunit A dimerization domain-containing protein n=1 Tax=Stylonychia lemnae TaxID=5949 RepID=A0A078B6E1_STYLE|nr:UNKNOWN [Stylonychia lemnae]|eukprot:CDW90095.1 UNKNOWN [Stylonychia lemnae]